MRKCVYVSLQAAKSVGGALRAFQPTIREVVEVSQELKGTLEKVSKAEDMAKQSTRGERSWCSVQTARVSYSLQSYMAKGGFIACVLTCTFCRVLGQCTARPPCLTV